MEDSEFSGDKHVHPCCNWCINFCDEYCCYFCSLRSLVNNSPTRWSRILFPYSQPFPSPTRFSSHGRNSSSSFNKNSKEDQDIWDDAIETSTFHSRNSLKMDRNSNSDANIETKSNQGFINNNSNSTIESLSIRGISSRKSDIYKEIDGEESISAIHAKQ